MNHNIANSAEASQSNSQSPRILYHYTDIKGLLGITQNKSIWATEIHFLNDSKEYAYAAHVLSKAAFDNRASLDSDGAAFLDVFVNTAKLVTSTKAFVTCFTEEEDDLSQWRAYSHSGPGYCIGFERSYLQDITAEVSLDLLTCEYDEIEQMRLMSSLIDETLAAAPESRLSARESENYVMSLPTVNKFIKLATQLKHPKFKAEKEHRIATKFMGGHPMLKTKVRAGTNLLVPYIEIPLPSAGPRKFISEIRIGPCPEPSLAEAAIYDLIVSESLQGIHVKQSEIPFRNW